MARLSDDQITERLRVTDHSEGGLSAAGFDLTGTVDGLR
jgi:hypothetical protein